MRRIATGAKRREEMIAIEEGEKRRVENDFERTELSEPMIDKHVIS